MFLLRFLVTSLLVSRSGQTAAPELVTNQEGDAGIVVSVCEMSGRAGVSLQCDR